MPSQKELFELHCIDCNQSMQFSLFDLESLHPIGCSHCGKKYGFSEEGLKRQLKKFALLCRQIHDSQEILGQAGVAINIGQEEVMIPYKLLLSRMRSTLDLQIGDKKLIVAFRIEPVSFFGATA